MPDGKIKEDAGDRALRAPGSPTSGTSLKGEAGSSIRGFKATRRMTVSIAIPLPSRLPSHPQQTEEEFNTPNSGVTVLRTSHGFDPNG